MRRGNTGGWAVAAMIPLLMPFASGAVALPDGVGFWLNPEAEALPPEIAARLTNVCDDKPTVDRLTAMGRHVGARPEGPAAFGLVTLGKQRDQNFGWLALALDLLAPGGKLVVAGANDIGAARYERELAAVLPLDGKLHKQHQRVFWTTRPVALPASVADWRNAAAARPILDGRYLSAPGAFSWDRIDPGSALLAAALPDAAVRGRVADLGCGWGYLADEVCRRCPGVTDLDLFEASRLALDLARANLAGHAARVTLGIHWQDVAAGIGAGRYDAIVCNPPFHTGKATRIDLGQAFIAAAAAALKPGGVLLLVANRSLPYEATLAASFKHVDRAAEAGGFKLFRAVR